MEFTHNPVGDAGGHYGRFKEVTLFGKQKRGLAHCIESYVFSVKVQI